MAARSGQANHIALRPLRRAARRPESLDKEFLRLWIRERVDPYKQPIPAIPAETLVQFSDKYIRLFETVTGRKFERPPLDKPVRDRIENALRKAFPEYWK